MKGLSQDLWDALRQMRRTPGFTAVTVLTLPVGIGASVPVFSVFDAVMPTPLLYRDPKRRAATWSSEIRQPGTAQPRFSSALLALFAAVGLLLAAAGIYGLVSLLVNQRTREIAIRVALGSTPKSVVQMMVARISVWILAGAIAESLARDLLRVGLNHYCLESSRLIGPLVEAAVVLLVAALVAAYIPARLVAKGRSDGVLRYE